VLKPAGDVAAWQIAVKQTMLRAAMLLADDLPASFEAMRHVVPMPAVRGAARGEGSEPGRDLNRVGLSNRAASVRQHAGMIGS
jgi:hypothetical protein